MEHPVDPILCRLHLELNAIMTQYNRKYTQIECFSYNSIHINQQEF
jgi:hypothetical protein